MMFRQKTCFFTLLVAVMTGCSPTPLTQNEIPSDTALIFQGGFEGQATVVPKGNDADIIGADGKFDSRNDWVKDLDEHPMIGNFNLQYQGGNSTMRYAKIVGEPANPGNKVLHFWLNEPNVGGSKGRIQANIYGGKGMKSFYQSVRVFLTEDFNTVKQYPRKISWCTIAEYWNDVTWQQTEPNGFRITLGVGKETAGESELNFILDAQDCQLFPDNSQKYTTIWSSENTKVPVPIGRWFTLNTYYKEGDAKNGKFRLTMTPDGGQEEVIFDITNFTHNTKDTNPDGVSDFNPLKLYTSKELINFMKERGKTLQMYWDDYRLSTGVLK